MERDAGRESRVVAASVPRRLTPAPGRAMGSPGCVRGRSGAGLRDSPVHATRSGALAACLPGEAQRLDERRSLGALELVHGAVAGILVRAPALEAGGVTEAVAGQLVVAHLDHQDRPDGDEVQVLVAAPATGRAGVASVLAEAGGGGDRRARAGEAAAPRAGPRPASR